MKDFQDYDDKELDSLIQKTIEYLNEGKDSISMEGISVTEDNPPEFSKSKTKKVLKPIKTVEQLVLSYEAAKAIRLLRNELKENEIGRALEHLPKLDIPSPDPRAVRLYREFAKKVKMSPVLVYITKIALEDMVRYGFKNSPSITKTGAQESEYLITSFGAKSMESFYKISLFDHTLNVFERALAKIDDLGRISGKEPAILAALLHDFGKSEAIRKEVIGENARGYKAHPEVSGLYIRTVLANKLKGIIGESEAEESLIDSIAKAAERHHSGKKNDLKDSFVQFVRGADISARKQEMASLIKNGKT